LTLLTLLSGTRNDDAGFKSPLPLPFGIGVPAPIGKGRGPLPFTVGAPVTEVIGRGNGPIPFIVGTVAAVEPPVVAPVVPPDAPAPSGAIPTYGMRPRHERTKEDLRKKIRTDDDELLELVAAIVAAGILE